MKKKQFLKTTLLALALAMCGASTAWADPTYQDLPLKSSSEYLDLSKYDGTLPTNVTWNSTGSRMDISGSGTYTIDYYVNVATADYYCVEAFIDWATNVDDRFTVTVTDVSSSSVEAEQTFEIKTGNNNKRCPITAGKITTGQKKISFTITINHSSSFKNVQFSQFVDSWPMAGETTEYLSLQNPSLLGPSSIRVEGDGTSGVGNGWRLGYVNANTYAEYYATNASTNYYSIKLKFYSAPVNNQVKLTITDVATTTTEVEQTFTVTTAGGDQEFIITNKVTSGLKKIRFDFISAFNQLQLVQFAVNSNIMDEAVDYTPVTASDVTVTLKRSISANKWSTIVLPFAMTNAQLKAAFGNDVKLAQFTAASPSALTFSAATELSANEPYMIYVSSDVSGEKTIENVDIASATPTKTISGVNFVGTYSKVKIPAGAYFVSNNNPVYNQAESSKRTIKPFRAYFTGIAAPSAGAPLQFIFDEETTGIAHVDVDGNISVEEGVFYNLSGQRVIQPTRGLYIVNGKKVVIK